MVEGLKSIAEMNEYRDRVFAAAADLREFGIESTRWRTGTRGETGGLSLRVEDIERLLAALRTVEG